MSQDVRYRVNAPKVTGQLIDGEAVMINLESGNYYNLNETGAEVWSYLEKRVPLAQIFQVISQRYEGELGEIQESVAQLIAELEKEELIVLENGDGAQRGPQLSPASAESTAVVRRMFEPPVLQKYTDMQDLLLLDPIHEVDELGWPRALDETAR